VLGALAAGTGRPAPPTPDRGATWQVGRAVPLQVVEGWARFDVPASAAGSRTLVVVSSLARSPGPFPVRLTTRPVAVAEPVRLAADGPPPPPAPSPSSSSAIPATASRPSIERPPGERRFSILVRDGDPASAGNYQEVRGVLRAVGKRVQVYVDSADVGRVAPATLRDVVATFDDRVYPEAARTIGTARDVDGDGRFTVLITGWLARLGGGRLAVDGFVRAADLDEHLDAPFGNRCDMLYLGAAVAAGPHLRTVLAHEYTHAVIATCKSAVGAGEEGWLDEAIAHLMEDRHGFSRSNLDYRVSAFLSAPERYRLVVRDYFAAGLFRGHGNRGSTYLFLRGCVDRFGPTLLQELAQSRLRGTEALEAATGERFEALFRRWSVALAVGGLDPKADRAAPDHPPDLRTPIGDWPLAGPRTTAVGARGGSSWSMVGTSPHFVAIDAGPGEAVQVEVAGPPGATLQVTAIRLPDDIPRIELSIDVQAGSGPDPVARVRVRERAGAPVQLVSLSWEPLVPGPDPRTAGFRRDGRDGPALATILGSDRLPARGMLAGGPIPLVGARPAHGPIVFKVVGNDPLGRRVAAWAEVKVPATKVKGR
jgi:hypothetical protein